MKKYDCEPEHIGNCNEHKCRYFDEKMELNCAYSDDNSKCIKTEKPINSGYPLLGEVREFVGFYIDDSDIRILHYNTRGCRPASDAEIMLWDYIKHFA
jgi:hypothetical protein